jgi:transaldolase
VSLFYNRIRDLGYDARTVVAETVRVLRQGGIRSEVIVGSIRHMQDVNEAMEAGADIVTVPPKFFRPMTEHPKTTEAVQQFLTEFRRWNER